jgi:uncharacterized protein (DUF2141 family)
VVVTGARSDRGTIEYGVYDRADAFPGDEGSIAGGEVPADRAGARIVVSGLKPGRYAIAVFHDENGNGAFDRGFLGIPLEDYGFSNDAPAFFGPPSFDDAAVTVGPGGTTVTIRLD